MLYHRSGCQTGDLLFRHPGVKWQQKRRSWQLLPNGKTFFFATVQLKGLVWALEEACYWRKTFYCSPGSGLVSVVATDWRPPHPSIIQYPRWRMTDGVFPAGCTFCGAGHSSDFALSLLDYGLCHCWPKSSDRYIIQSIGCGNKPRNICPFSEPRLEKHIGNG